MLTQGDPHGIGPEIILKVLPTTPRHPIVILGSWDVLEYYAKQCSLTTQLNRITRIKRNKSWFSLEPGYYLVDLAYTEVIRPGQLAAEAGKHAKSCIDYAMKLIHNQQSNIVVTAPVNKQAIRFHEPNFIGHTEYLAQWVGLHPSDVTMTFLADGVRLFLVTTHHPASEVPNLLTPQRLDRTIHHAYALTQMQADSRPLAMMSLNPHAGEGGVLGMEEEHLIKPAVNRAQQNHIAIEGPFPNDSLWRSFPDNRFSGYIALTHDTGLIPFKMVSKGLCVNITLGLPFVRVSVDHGTGFDIAGTNSANASSLGFVLGFSYLL